MNPKLVTQRVPCSAVSVRSGLHSTAVRYGTFCTVRYGTYGFKRDSTLGQYGGTVRCLSGTKLSDENAAAACINSPRC
eukprot:361614-Chlamydomonas_euryale.AAC.4